MSDLQTPVYQPKPGDGMKPRIRRGSMIGVRRLWLAAYEEQAIAALVFVLLLAALIGFFVGHIKL